jgi:hypothetical protein
MRRLVGSGLLALLATGCAAAPQDTTTAASESGAETVSGGESFFQGVGRYFGNRGMDLVDIFSLRLTAGPGLRISARVTEVLQVGVGMTGPDVSSAAQPTAFPAYQVGWLRREGGVWRARIAEAGFSLLYYFGSEGTPIMGSKTRFGEQDRGFFDVGFAVHAAVVGAEAEVRLDEIADFLLGLVGIDFMRDDAEAPGTSASDRVAP